MNETPWNFRFPAPQAVLRGLGFLILLSGCDGLDLKSVLTPSARAGPEVERDLTTVARRDPSMESIGPEAAKRIYYQFIDDRGQVQFVERLSDVPAAWREQVGFVEMSQPPPLTPIDARKTWQVSANRANQIRLAAAARVTPDMPVARRPNDDVVLYFAKWCGYCKLAKAHLDRERVDYDLRDVDNDAVSRELREKTGRGGIPVLDFGGEILRGYSEGQYDEAIRTIQG